MKSFFLFLIAIFFNFNSINPLLAQQSYPGLEDVTWETGQVIGISEMKSDPSTFIFEAGTGSRYGHVGIIAIEDTKVFVYESTPPVAQRTLLSTFLSKTNKNSDGILEATIIAPIVPLRSQESLKLIRAMKKAVKKEVPYNFSVIINDESMNCSEFVYKMFQNIKITIGEIETFSQMNINGFQGQLINFFGANNNISPQSKIITPVSVINSPTFKVVKANLPVNKLISEFEIFNSWKNQNGFDELAQMMGLPVDEILLMEEIAMQESYRTYPQNWRQ